MLLLLPALQTASVRGRLLGADKKKRERKSKNSLSQFVPSLTGSSLKDELMVLSGCHEDEERSWEYEMGTGCVNLSAGKSPSVHSSFSHVPQGPLRRLLPANGLPPEALAADTLLNDFRQLTQQGRCCKVLQLLLLL